MGFVLYYSNSLEVYYKWVGLGFTKTANILRDGTVFLTVQVNIYTKQIAPVSGLQVVSFPVVVSLSSTTINYLVRSTTMNVFLALVNI